MLGREDKLNEVLTEALHKEAKRLGDYTPIRDTFNGRWFEVRMGGDRVMKVLVTYERAEP